LPFTSPRTFVVVVVCVFVVYVVVVVVDGLARGSSNSYARVATGRKVMLQFNQTADPFTEVVGTFVLFRHRRMAGSVVRLCSFTSPSKLLPKRLAQSIVRTKWSELRVVTLFLV
jgi:hypothetical protein